MSMVQSWFATAAVFFVIFIVGLLFRAKEKQERMAKKLAESESMYGPPPLKDRRSGRDRRQSQADEPVVAHR
jgi:Na+/melibiose symporter-like transporter